ncbi:MAG: hypothetical protein RIS09_410 [Actinomycetota bacterium]|jgi:hypothetical protein
MVKDFHRLSCAHGFRQDFAMTSLVELRSRLTQAPTRLLLGIVIMLISGFLANNALAMNDTSAVKVLVANSNLASGQKVTLEDFSSSTISKTVEESQWALASAFDEELFLRVSLKKGDVLQKSAVINASLNLSEVSILLNPGSLPLNLKVGDTVDVWSVAGPALLLAARLTVTAIEMASNEFTVSLLVPSSQVEDLLSFKELSLTVPL